jgi:ferrous iron transport protein B
MSECADCAGCGPAAVATLPSAAVKAVAVIGPPNSGKTTLFNRLTGLRQKVANFPGVTVEQHTGVAELAGGQSVELIDLPGVYSLSPHSEDEQVAYDVLTGRREDTPKPEAILLVLDSTNLRRHLMLAAPILALGLPTLIILNMADDLRNRGGTLDTKALSRELGAPVALVSARQDEGIEQVRDFLAGAMALPTPRSLPVLHDIPKCREWAGAVGSQADYRAPIAPKWTRRLDRVMLHPVAGPLIFAFVVVLVFQSIFSYVTPLMDGVKWLFDVSGNWIATTLPPSLVRSLVVDGVWRGVGSVIVFLPQVLLLFLFIGILEDSGYLARAALIADRTMARFGLQGKSFIPLLSAYACAVPAILSTRTIENKRDRTATILIAPFMTCAARFPVYTLIIAAFLPNRQLLGFLSVRTVAMIGLYALGFVVAVLTARILKSSILKSGRTPFVLEMPAYRWPTVQSLGLRLLDRSKVFLRRAGTVILLVTVLLWTAAHVPYTHGHPPAIRDSLAGTLGRSIEPVIKPLGFDWKIGIGIITSFAARETIIATLGAIYGMDHPDSTSMDLQSALRHDLTPASAVALLIFFAFAMQCVSTVAVVRRETGGWKWPLAQFAYMSALAYGGAFLAAHLLRYV